MSVAVVFEALALEAAPTAPAIAAADSAPWFRGATRAEVAHSLRSTVTALITSTETATLGALGAGDGHLSRLHEEDPLLHNTETRLTLADLSLGREPQSGFKNPDGTYGAPPSDLFAEIYTFVESTEDTLLEESGQLTAERLDNRDETSKEGSPTTAEQLDTLGEAEIIPDNEPLFPRYEITHTESSDPREAASTVRLVEFDTVDYHYGEVAAIVISKDHHGTLSLTGVNRAGEVTEPKDIVLKAESIVAAIGQAVSQRLHTVATTST